MKTNSKQSSQTITTTDGSGIIYSGDNNFTSSDLWWPNGATVTTTGGNGGWINITSGDTPVELSDKEKFFQGQFRCLGKSVPPTRKSVDNAEKIWKAMVRKKVDPIRLDVDTELIRLGLAKITERRVCYRDPDDPTIFYDPGSLESPFSWCRDGCYHETDTEAWGEWPAQPQVGDLVYSDQSDDLLYFDGVDWYTITT